MSAVGLAARPAALAAVERRALPDARPGRLNYAQVREDPALEIETLRPGADDTLVVISSGGCTALSLLAAGAGRVVAVDQNPVQNHLVELKAAAVRHLARSDALAFLGAVPAPAALRARTYAALRSSLSPQARAYWDGRGAAVGAGVIDSGVTERFIRLVMAAMRLLVHPSGRIRRLLACRTVEEQVALYRAEWDNRRWRAMFRLLLNRRALSRVYEPGYFAHLERPSFAEHFRRRAEHTLTRLPVRDNYFVHHMLTGRYPVDEPGGVPPYLGEGGAAVLRDALDRLTLVDAGCTSFLRRLPSGSVTGFVISNICEWLTPPQIDELFREIVRTAAPGARLCFRNFVGWTEVPERWRAVVVEDRERGEALMERDRSVVQRRFAVCRVQRDRT